MTRTISKTIKGQLSAVETWAWNISAYAAAPGPLRDTIREMLLDECNRPAQRGQGGRMIDTARINAIICEVCDRYNIALEEIKLNRYAISQLADAARDQNDFMLDRMRARIVNHLNSNVVSVEIE